jgi:hypothetical protein
VRFALGAVDGSRFHQTRASRALKSKPSSSIPLVNLKRARERQTELRGSGVEDLQLALELVYVLAGASDDAHDIADFAAAFDQLDHVRLDRFALASALTFDHWKPLGVGGRGTKNELAARATVLTVSTGRRTTSPPAARAMQIADPQSQCPH